MRYLIDEFKKTATLFAGHSRIMQPITYTCFENAVCFTMRASNIELQILFNQVDGSDDIQCHISVNSVGNLGGTHDRVLSNYLKHEGDNIIKFTYEDVNRMYATLIGNQLIEYPESAPLLIELIDRSKNVISNFINEVNDRELIRSHYQQETTMSNENTVTKDKIDKLLERSTKEFAFFDNTMTIAVVKLPCGFKVTGQSSCVDPANFNEEKGKLYALEKVHDKLWELEGYLLANDIYRENVRSYQGGQ